MPIYFPSPKSTTNGLRWQAVLGWSLLVLFVIVLGAASGFLYVQLRDLPGIEQLEEFQPAVITRVYSDTDEVFAEYYQQKRILVPFSRIPKYFIDALVAVEDVGFYKHWGIDFRGIARALWADIRAGRIVEGGSTLTQQLAKVLFLTSEKSLSRKLKEALLALQIEKKYTKAEILELYCNQIYLGGGVYGIEAASRAYFNKPVQELTLTEAALIAGLPKSPNRYSPITHPERAFIRRNHVLRRMAKAGFISQDQAKQAQAQPVRVNRPIIKEGVGDYFSEAVRRYVEEQYGFNMLYKRGLNIYTSLNLNMQRAAEAAVKQGLADLNRRQKYAAGVMPQAALLALDPHSGYVKAMLGGTDFSASQFNRAVQARRQPGSAFKPIVYAAAILAGYPPTYIINDSPLVIPNPATKVDWKPANFDGWFHGNTTLRKGLEKSRNVVAVKLLLEIGPQAVISLARRLGIHGPLKPYPSLALGAFEVTPLELVSSYAVFASGGLAYEPNIIRYITDKQGNILEEHIPYPQTVLPPDTAYIVTHMLEGVVESGTGWRAKALKRAAAAKTGTTDDYADAWFVGYVPSLVAGVWVGHDLKISLGEGETGSRAAGPIWVDFMQQALNDQPAEEFSVPEDVVLVEIDAKNSMLATSNCPEIIKEAFKAGTEPTEFCEQHPL